jgi:putative transposase
MGAPLAIRTDLEAADLRRPARRERDGRVAARLIALANVLDGMSRAAAARAAGMDRHPCTSAAAMLFWARDGAVAQIR